MCCVGMNKSIEISEEGEREKVESEERKVKIRNIRREVERPVALVV